MRVVGIQAALASASWVGVRLMTGYRALEITTEPLLLAVVGSMFAAPTVVLALPMGRLTDRYGGGTTTTVGLLISCLGAMAVALLPISAALLIATALLVGLGQMLVMVGQQTLVAHTSRGLGADAAFGTMSAGAAVGQLIGPPLVTGVAVVAGSSPVPNTLAGLIAAAACAGAALPLSLYLSRHTRSARMVSPPSATGAGNPWVEVLSSRGIWRVLLVSSAVLVTVDLLFIYVPLWAVERQIAPFVVGLLLALRALVSVLSRLRLRWLVLRFGRSPLIAIALIAGVVGLCALPFANAWTAVPVMIALGIATGLPQPLTMAWTTAITPSTVHGAALGLRLTVNRLAQLLLPLAVGAIAGPVGVAAVFWANAMLLLVSVPAVGTSRADPDTETG